MKTFSILTLGCKVNQYESESMKEIFEKNGYIEVSSETDVADVYVVNTCTVTNLSDRKSRQYIRRAKRENPESIVCVVGCYSQVSPDEVKAIEGVDIIMGTTDRNRIVELVENFETDKSQISIVKSLKGFTEFQHIEIDKESEMTRSYMKVQDGCNRFCTYCIIPYARGPIRSRTIEDSVEEAKRLSEAGYKEIVLTGIHIGSYGKDLGDERLVDLIEEIAKVDGIERIRLSSIEPITITRDFLERIKATGKVCDHFHLSLQSGSNSVLKSMNRRYTREEYIETCDLIREYFPHVGLTTDIIVGFPGETDEDFEDTVDLVKRVEFSKIHVFKYSKRSGTPAADMANQVDGNIKIERSNRLLELSDKMMERFIEKNRNTTLKVLFEEEKDGFIRGYSTNYIDCKIKTDLELKNQVRDVKIVAVDGESAIVEIERS